MERQTIYTTGDDRIYLDSLQQPLVISTTSSFRLRTGEVLTNKQTGDKFKYLNMLGQSGDICYLLVLPILQEPVIAAA